MECTRTRRTRTVAAGIVALAGATAPMAAAAAPTATPRAAVTRPAATTPAEIPGTCDVDLAGPGSSMQLRRSYSSGRTVLTEFLRLSIPAGSERHEYYRSPLDDERAHALVIYADGRMVDATHEVGLAVEDEPVTRLARPASTSIPGRTLAGIVDLQQAQSTVDGWGVTRDMYAVTSNGRLHDLPLAYTRSGATRVGKAQPLTRRGLPAIKGIEHIGIMYAPKTKKVTQDLLLAHTKDGRLLRLAVDRTGKTPRLASSTVVANGWKNITGIKIGRCWEPWNGKGRFLLAVDASKGMTAYTGLDWNTTTTRSLKPVRLVRWPGRDIPIY